MLSTSTLSEYNMSKHEVTDLIRYMDSDDKVKEKLKKAEAHSLEKTDSTMKRAREAELTNEASLVLAVAATKHGEKKPTAPSRAHGCCMSIYLSCFGCKDGDSKKKANSDDKVVGLWAKKHCGTREEFFDLMTLTTKNVRATWEALKGTKEFLEYRDRDTETTASTENQGLSKIGGTMWLLTFTIQHLIDPEKKYANLTSDLIKIRAQFQEMGSHTQQFVNNSESFFNKVDEMRENCISIIKRLKEVYPIKGNPFSYRPEIHSRKRRIKKRIDYGYDDPTVDPEDKGTFQVHWITSNVLFRYKEGDGWEDFAHFGIEDKLAIFKAFADSTVTFIEEAMTNYTAACQPMNNLITAAKASTLNEITSAFYMFLVTEDTTKDPRPTESDLINWRALVDDFWIAIDLLYDIAYELNISIQESRDLVRTCYVYTTNFYHWKLSNFDDFDPVTKTNAYKANLRRAHFFIAKLMGHQRYADAAMFLSLADFSSSIYQEVVKTHTVAAYGMRMKLESYQEEAVDETWGLVADSYHKNPVIPGRNSFKIQNNSNHGTAKGLPGPGPGRAAGAVTSNPKSVSTMLPGQARSMRNLQSKSLIKKVPIRPMIPPRPQLPRKL